MKNEPTATPFIAVAALALSATSAFAIDYLSPAQAQAILFPTAKAWKEQATALTTEQLQNVGRLGQVNARSAAWKLLHALDDKGNYLGSVVIDNVVGKFELITYAVKNSLVD